jgi:DNA-binding CsgD family transcriptional regulator
MDFMGAVDWVDRNRRKIIRQFRIFRIYSPFEEHDYMQETFVAAFVAVQRSKRKGIPFQAAFWTIFQERIVTMTPNPGYASCGSNSVPSHLCVVDIDTVVIPQKEEENGPDIEVIYNMVYPYLTGREQRMLCLKLGLTYEGALSNYEIARLLGCGESNVRDALNKALKRIRDLVRRGIIKPDKIH